MPSPSPASADAAPPSSASVSAATTTRSATWPLAAGALATASFVGMDAAVKSLTPRFDALQLTTLRFAAGAVFAWALWAWFRTPLPAQRQWASHALRCVLLLCSLLGYFHALTLLPLTEAVAMSYLAPIFVALLAITWLKERPSRWLWLALLLGLAGVAVSLLPELLKTTAQASATPRRLEGLLSAGLSAVAFAGVIVLARQQAQSDSPWTILLVQNTLPLAVLGLALLAFGGGGWQPMAWADLPTVALIGALATVGLLSLTWAFTHLEATRVAPLEYTSFVWAALLGYALFGEVPSVATALSAALIVAGCLVLMKR